MDEAAKESASKKVARTIRVDIVNAPFFRSVQADGVWSRVSPYGQIHLSFYNECVPIPNSIEQDVMTDGNWGPEPPRLNFSTNASTVRQVEVDVILSVEAAKRVRQNIDEFIRIAEADKQ